MKKRHTQRQPDETTDNGDDNVEKIRDILFGGQMRHYEQRLADLETRLSQDIQLIATSIEKRMDRLDSFTTREFEKLGDQVKAERKERKDEGRHGAKELKALVRQWESRCGELDEQIGTEALELRGALEKLGDDLTAMIHAGQEDLRTTLVMETRGLVDQSLAREDMIALLSDAASRLKKNANPPGA